MVFADRAVVVDQDDIDVGFEFPILKGIVEDNYVAFRDILIGAFTSLFGCLKIFGIAKEMAPQYPDVVTDYMFVDNAAMKMLTEPKSFDVMVTENTFGDILTDEGSCISGSMGLLPSASTGESTPVFEPIHGSWPQAKGLNIANPLAQILSVAMLYEYFGLQDEGALIRKAVDASLDENVRTPEIQVEGGAKYGTKEVGEWIVNYIKNA